MTEEENKVSTKSMLLHESAFGDLFISPYAEGRDYGSEGIISVKDLEISLGDRPVCKNLRNLYELSNREVPPEIEVFDLYDIWLITHTIGIIKRENSTAKVKSIGYQADFTDARQVFTIDLLPRTKFVSTIEIGSKTEVALGLEGHAQIPEAIKMLLEQVEYIGGDASIKLSSDNKIVGNLSFSILTPVIQAVGMGASRCEWIFEEDKEPLLGDQMMIQTILVPKGTPSITFKARGYAFVKAGWISFPVPFYTDELELTCLLQ